MGGGHVTRPDRTENESVPQGPYTEFYRLLQQGIDETGCVCAPGAYVTLRLPAGHKLYREDLPEYTRLYARQTEGAAEIFAPLRLRVKSASLYRDAAGEFSALLLQCDGVRESVALQLYLPGGAAGVPEPPKCSYLLRVCLTMQDMFTVDENPAALAKALCSEPQRMQWLAHPKISRWMDTALEKAQRYYNRGLY